MKWIFILGATVFCGCNTFSTTAIDRLENDTLVVNPCEPMKGIPVSLRVPTHLELNVIETTYWEKVDVSGEKPRLAPLRTCRPTRTVEHTVCYTEKVFLVDPVRPCSGTQNYGFSFTSNDEGKKESDAGKGYLSSVSYKVDDTTIKESANLLANSLGLLQAFSTSASDANPITGSLIATDRTVAFVRLDINSPTFEQDVSEFLESKVNQTPLTGGSCPTVCEPPFCQ